MLDIPICCPHRTNIRYVLTCGQWGHHHSVTLHWCEKIHTLKNSDENMFVISEIMFQSG